MSEPRFIKAGGNVFNLAVCLFIPGGNPPSIVENIPFDDQPTSSVSFPKPEGWQPVDAWLDAGMPWKPIGGGMLMDLDRWYEGEKGNIS